MDPNNPLNRYQKATVLISLGRLREALSVLEELSTKLPREGQIHILIGNIYKELGNLDIALSHYNIALDLEPKEASLIRNLIEKLNRQTEDENYDDF